ncbi:helix-turn-helix domain-containing protein [Roseicyclus amphidinii]|uniref:helix-turn-helix domain-containing protein n=1 Tax=Roseicyclus amphidinii TaxID=3034232 RepID=UPI0024E121E6|nr:helix-turn-helix domain-containing protein [Roseicyclus sp. Amp-Y-6]
MSITLIKRIGLAGPENKTQCLVLTAIASFVKERDQAGPAYMGIKTLAAQTRLHERTVQRVVQALEDEGWLFRTVGGGRKGLNAQGQPVGRPSEYRINLARLFSAGSAAPLEADDEHPPTSERVAAQSAKGGTPPPLEAGKGWHPVPERVASDPAKGGTTPPEQEGIKKGTRNTPCSPPAETPATILEAVASPDAVASFLSYRRSSRKGPVSCTAARRLAKQLAEIAARGGDPDDALGEAEERGWATVKADWFNKKRHRNEQLSGADLARSVADEFTGKRRVDRRQGGNPPIPLFPPRRA